MTQERLAERAGLSAKAISALERGERRHPYPHTVRALATALDLEVEDRALLEGSIAPRGHRLVLPVPLAPLIGREEEVGTLAGVLLSGRHRLLTLAGPGGVGKTRLAQAVAANVEPGFADGAALVSLAPLRDSRFVIDAVAEVLGIRASGTEPLREVLHRFLRSRQALLVLDNLEHLLDSAVDIAGMLGAAPRLAVLATSRAVLGIQGERVHRVQPLVQRAAVELFTERVRLVTQEIVDAGTAAEICRRLDRLPLAIELAAARVPTLSPPALLTRLDHALTLLAGGRRDLPERQQTLRRTIEWSYNLLDAPEQALLRRLSVFVGGWTLDAAAAVAQLDDATAVELHSRLVDGSLVLRGPADGEPRFQVLDTIRAFAADELEASGEAEAVRDRHAAHYRRIAATAARGLMGPDQASWQARLQRDHENLRTALGRLLERGHLSEVADTCLALWLFWMIGGHLDEGLHWAGEVLAGAARLDAGSRAKALVTAGAMRYARGQYEEAGADLDEAAAILHGMHEPETLALALALRGYVCVVQGEHSQAIRTLREAEALGRAAAQPFLATMAAAASTVVSRARLSEADAQLTVCEAEMRDLGNPWSLGVALNLHAWVCLLRGRHGDAEDRAREAVVMLGQLNDVWAMMHGLTILADAVALQADYARAARLYGSVDVLVERSGARLFHFYQATSEHCREQVERHLGSARFDVLRQEGRALPLEAVLTLATGTDG